MATRTYPTGGEFLLRETAPADIFTPEDFDETQRMFAATVADFVERLSPQIRLQRLGSEVTPRLKLAPTWNLRLSELAPRLDALLEERGSWQGCRRQK